MQVLKYILRYETEITHKDFRILIYEEGFLGLLTYKSIGASRVRLEKATDGKICGTSLNFAIQADADMEYLNFFTADNKAHKVEFEYNHTVIWTGYIVSDQYSEPYIAPPYDVDVLCTDGLGLLKNTTFAASGMMSRFAAIRYIIDQISLGLGYLVNVNYFEAQMNAGLCLLDQLYFNADAFAGKTCYEVLASLIPEGATITQDQNRWLIERSIDTGTVRKKYSSAGALQTGTVSVPILDLGKISDARIYPEGNITMEMTPSLKQITLKSIYGKKDSFLSNYDFKNGTTGWTSNLPTTAAFAVKTNGDGLSYAVLPKLSTIYPNKRGIYQSVQVIASAGIVFEINFAIIGKAVYNVISGITYYSQIKNAVQFKVKLVGISNTVYTLDQTGWKTADNIITVKEVESSISYESVNFQNLKIEAGKFPENGTLTVSIFQLEQSHFDQYASALCIENVKIYSTDIAGFADTEETVVNLTPNATKSDLTIELMPTDLPNFPNATLYFLNGNYQSVAGLYVQTAKWGVNSDSYVVYLAKYFANLYQNPLSILKGNLVLKNASTPFAQNAVFRHIYNDNKLFSVNSATWNIIEETLDCELHQLPVGTATPTIPDPFDPVYNLLNNPLIETAQDVYYRVVGSLLINRVKDNAHISTVYIDFTSSGSLIFDRSRSVYWSGLTIFYSNNFLWPLSEINAATIAAHGTAAMQARLFWNDYIDTVTDVLPIISFAANQANASDIQNFVNQNQILSGQHLKSIDGSFETPIPGTMTAAVVSRALAIDPMKLDYDSGTPQFSLKATLIEPNYGGNPNSLKVNAGQLINHNFNALDRTSIGFVKQTGTYDPTRTWNIADQTITLPTDNGHFIYVKIPLT